PNDARPALAEEDAAERTLATQAPLLGQRRGRTALARRRGPVPFGGGGCLWGGLLARLSRRLPRSAGGGGGRSCGTVMERRHGTCRTSCQGFRHHLHRR